jgi:hypothetical protein
VQFQELCELARRASSADLAGADREAVVDTVRAVDLLVAWCEARRLECARALLSMGAVAEQALATASRSSVRDADLVVQRAGVADAAPSFGLALGDGRVAVGHLDQLGRSLRRLKPDQRSRLLADSARLLAIAADSTPDEFGRTLRSEERRLAGDDGMDRLARQRAAVRLRSRLDLDSGMQVFTLHLDPVSGVKLHNRIQAATEALFHSSTPEGCPTDPIEKQAFLRAHALLALLDGKVARSGRPEIVVVVDTTVHDQPPQVDWGLPVEIPDRVLRDLWPDADVHVVVVRNGVVLHAPGQLDLGRTTRLANRAQRRALRALYATCAVPGCASRFDNCTVHHVEWWRNGGPTDLANLLPICSKHHHLVHEGGWQLHLGHDRALTVTMNDGTIMTTGPPNRAAA